LVSLLFFSLFFIVKRTNTPSLASLACVLAQASAALKLTDGDVQKAIVLLYKEREKAEEIAKELAERQAHEKKSGEQLQDELREMFLRVIKMRARLEAAEANPKIKPEVQRPRQL
jgi:hypothetical protein